MPFLSPAQFFELYPVEVSQIGVQSAQVVMDLITACGAIPDPGTIKILQNMVNTASSQSAHNDVMVWAEQSRTWLERALLLGVSDNTKTEAEPRKI